MKKYTIKNYKGNLVESLKKFSDSYKGMKIVEAVEDGKDLKIKAVSESTKDEVNNIYDSFIDELNAALNSIAEFELDDSPTTLRFAEVLENVLNAIEKEYTEDDIYYKQYKGELHNKLNALKTAAQAWK